MNIQQQAIETKPGIEATVFLKSTSDSQSVASTIDLLNTQPGITYAEPSIDHPLMIEVRFDPEKTRGKNIIRTLTEFRNRWTCITIMYCKGGDGPDFEQHVIQAITEQPGVIAAERSLLKGYAFMVHFDQRKTRASQIVNELRRQGYSAMLFGC